MATLGQEEASTAPQITPWPSARAPIVRPCGRPRGSARALVAAALPFVAVLGLIASGCGQPPSSKLPVSIQDVVIQTYFPNADNPYQTFRIWWVETSYENAQGILQDPYSLPSTTGEFYVVELRGSFHTNSSPGQSVHQVPVLIVAVPAHFNPRKLVNPFFLSNKVVRMTAVGTVQDGSLGLRPTKRGEVPDVVGLDATEATGLLTSDHITWTEHVTHNVVEDATTIVAESPAPGAKLNGRRVVIDLAWPYWSTGGVQVPTPEESPLSSLVVGGDLGRGPIQHPAQTVRLPRSGASPGRPTGGQAASRVTKGPQT
jgi:hypothetical protein